MLDTNNYNMLVSRHCMRMRVLHSMAFRDTLNLSPPGYIA